MGKKIACLFPGQGAQYVGMGKDFYESYPLARETFEEANDLLGLDLSKILFEGPVDQLMLTSNSQPAIYVMSIALWRVLKKEFPEVKPAAVAGLSLGEYSALTVSERLSFQNGVRLVFSRGQYMYEAGLKYPGTMAVILGMTLEKVQQTIDLIDGVWIANLNCPGQIVVSGTASGIKKAETLLKKSGAKRVLPLDVSGAFHSGLMEEAKERLQQKIEAIDLCKSSVGLVMNASGDFVSENEIRQRMIEQVVSPVYWEQGIRKMEEKGIELFVEIGPGKTLSGMNRKIGVKGKIMNIEKTEDLELFSQGALSNVT